MVSEVMNFFEIEALAHLKEKALIIDATIGGGGHTEEFLKRGINVLGIDADKQILEVAKRRLIVYLKVGRKACPSRLSRKAGLLTLVQGNFRSIEKIAHEAKFFPVDGILFDLGISSLELSDPVRGFSFQNPASPLDMRFDPTSQTVDAAILLNALRQDQLGELFSKTLPESSARYLAAKIVEKRKVAKIASVGDFLQVIGGIRELPRGTKIHPATKPFLALRMAVNSEVENLRDAINGAFSLLKKGGRLLVISFHSEEDAVVKRFFRTLYANKEGEILTKKPVRPTLAEIAINPRARSARLRALKKSVEYEEKTSF